MIMEGQFSLDFGRVVKVVKFLTGLQPVSRPVELVHYCGG